MVRGTLEVTALTLGCTGKLMGFYISDFLLCVLGLLTRVIKYFRGCYQCVFVPWFLPTLHVCIHLHDCKYVLVHARIYVCVTHACTFVRVRACTDIHVSPSFRRDSFWLYSGTSECVSLRMEINLISHFGLKIAYWVVSVWSVPSD